MEVGFHETGIGSWSLDYGRYLPKTLSALGDPRLAMPQMTEIARRMIADDATLSQKIATRKARIAARHEENFARWAAEADADREGTPITPARLAQEVWSVIQNEDWVLAAGTLRQWTRKLWDFDTPHRHPGKGLGTSTQIGIGLGVALAHKGTDRVVVTFQPDGDLMYDAGALWTAAKHQIPLLIVMFNNRAYYNDWHHQIRMARLRGTDEARAHIGMDLYGPAPISPPWPRAWASGAKAPASGPRRSQPRCPARSKLSRPASPPWSTWCAGTDKGLDGFERQLGFGTAGSGRAAESPKQQMPRWQRMSVLSWSRH